MADSIPELIANDIDNSMNGQSIIYDGDSHTITCERQRQVLNINGQYPFVEVFGPIITVTENGNRSNDSELRFAVEFHAQINDESGDPITERLGNVPADLIKLIMADITRAGNALKTDYDGFGHYLNPDRQEIIYYIDIVVQSFISETNPYNRGA